MLNTQITLGILALLPILESDMLNTKITLGISVLFPRPQNIGAITYSSKSEHTNELEIIGAISKPSIAYTKHKNQLWNICSIFYS